MARGNPNILFVPPMTALHRRYIFCWSLLGIVMLYIWYSINGGFIPKFLVPKLPYFRYGPEISPLVYFTVDSDASKIRWARHTNSRQALMSSLNDPKVHMISGDVILKGQGTKSQKLEPVMARPPSTDSDITLQEWLQETQVATKGIKLHIHSMEAVEISLQILKEMDKSNAIQYPVWIHVDVLQGPHGGKPVIDFTRFFKTVQREFPSCTVSVGWTTGTHTDLSQSAYTWNMVWEMLELFDAFEMSEDMQIIFQARLSLIRNSVPQLKWLCDNVKHSSLMIWHESGDMVVHEDIMYIAYRFPPHGVYFDLNHQTFETLLAQYRHFSRDKVESLVLKRDEVIFKPGQWLKLGFWRQKHSVMGSTEAMVLAAPIAYIITKTKYKPSEHIYLQGRVQFLNRHDREGEEYRTGLAIYLRPSEYAMYDNIVGIKCYIGVNGEIEVTGSNLPSKIENFRQTSRLTPTRANCFRFRITDEGSRVVFSVKAQHECITLDSVMDEEELLPLLTVPIPSKLRVRDPAPFLIKMEDVRRQAVIDELSVREKIYK